MPRIKGMATVIGLVANYAACFGLKLAGCTIFGFTFHPFLLGGIGENGASFSCAITSRHTARAQEPA